MLPPASNVAIATVPTIASGVFQSMILVTERNTKAIKINRIDDSPIHPALFPKKKSQ